MIQWREQKAELPLHSVERLRGRLHGEDARLVETCLASGALVIVEATARADVERHLTGSRDEQGGLLVGEVFVNSDPNGDATVAAVLVRCGIPATELESSGVSLRMESGVWTRAREALHEGELIVGWYHSHPGIGAFFSDTDRATQRAFFPHPFSLGWVRDPVYAEECWYATAQSVAVPAERVITLAGLPRPF